MLEIHNLRIEYPGFALHADLTLDDGTAYAMLGPSGAGKSTLLSAIGGFVAPSAGAIILGGRDITGLPPGERGFATIFQDQNLFPHMSVAQNVGLALSPSLRLDAQDHQRIEDALKRVELFGLSARRPAELSGGQQARVVLARTLLQRADFLLLDEAFAALGPALRRDMLQLVQELCRDAGQGLIMITHDPRDAELICPKTIVVAAGRAQAARDTAQVLANPGPELAAYLGGGPK